MNISLLTAADEQHFSAWFSRQAEASLWQSLNWKTYQEALHRETKLYLAHAGDRIIGSALVIIDRGSYGLSTWDVPRGPIGERNAINALAQTIIADATKDRALAVYFSPFSALPMTLARSNRHEQPAATIVLSLTNSDDELLAQMHPKGRYNINVARRHLLRVEQAADTTSFARLAKLTASRDRFTGHDAAQYDAFLKHIPGAFLLLAYAPDQPKAIAGLLGVVHGSKAYYYYGASDHAFRALMAPYLLQWEAMQLSRRLGAASYDLFGIAKPDAGNDDPWQGITAFKRKFGGAVEVYPDEVMAVLRPVAYHALQLKRRLIG